MDYTFKDGRVCYTCGCSFQIIGEPPFAKSNFPAIKYNPDTFYPDHDINFACPAAWELLMKGQTVGVFQLESPVGQSNARKLKPDNMNELAALSAIIRPGTSQSRDEEGVSMTEHYCRRKNLEEDFTFLHDSLRPALEKTWGVLIYQESAMRIAQDLAGFTEQEADGLRKAIGKKLPEEMAKIKILFIEGCKKTGIVSDEIAAQIFDWIEKSQRYSFNRCISFDTKILRPNGGKYSSQAPYTVEEMYMIRNDINYAKKTGHLSLYKKWKLKGNYGKGLSLYDDGRIRPNTIENIQQAGNKKVYKITLKDGSTIRVTGNHKFPTSNGELTIEQILETDYTTIKLYTCGEYEGCDNSYTYSSLTNDDRKLVGGTSGKGVFGKNNRWFTNGSYSQFKKFKKITPNICFDCGARAKRIETHHIDGDRTNSNPDNLTKLCVSCHKKREYLAGRTKRGEKGYPSILTEIESIVEDGECMTYDVTMGAPNHNFVVDGGMVTSNSHAIGYGILGYICAYTKIHFPIQYYTSCLLYAQAGSEAKERVGILTDDAKLMDIYVAPPDLTQLENNFYTDGQNIYFGLSDIKDVGPLALDRIKELLAEKNIDINTVSWYDFLLDVLGNISITVAHRLIETGALRRFDMPRKRMIAEYDIWHSELKKDTERQWILDRRDEFSDVCSAFKAVARVRKEGGGCFTKTRVGIIEDHVKSLENPPNPFDDTPDWITWCEKEYLGISLTYSELDKYDISRASHTCKDIVKGHRAYAVLGVELKEVKPWKTKTGKNPGQEMAFIKAADTSCALDIVVFPKVWKEFSHLLTEGNVVFISGKMSKGGSFQVEKVYLVEDDDE